LSLALSILLLSSPLFLCTEVAAAPSDWNATVIANVGDIYVGRSIAIDSLDGMHICYYDSTNGSVRYASYQAGSWTVTDIGSGIGCSIALDHNNKVHICYLNVAKNEILQTTNAGGQWLTIIVDSGSFDSWTSTACDSNNNVHVSYHDLANNDLKYANDVSGSWSTITVDSVGSVGYDSSIAIDSNNKVHISYLDNTNSNLKYATNAGGSWVDTTIDTDGDTGHYTSLALDSQNKVHITYRNEGRHEVWYATDNTGSWIRKLIASSAGFYSGIATDSNNKIHLSYEDRSGSGGLGYATNAGGDWVTSLVRSGSVGRGSSIAIDSKNSVHICYYDTLNKTVDYATNAGGSINPTSVPTMPASLGISGLGSIVLSWAPPNAGHPITEYRIYRGDGPGKENFLIAIDGNLTTFTDSTAAEGKSWYYRISAVNAVGEGILSIEVSTFYLGSVYLSLIGAICIALLSALIFFSYRRIESNRKISAKGNLDLLSSRINALPTNSRDDLSKKLEEATKLYEEGHYARAFSISTESLSEADTRIGMMGEITKNISASLILIERGKALGLRMEDYEVALEEIEQKVGLGGKDNAE
jgi:hypothetical protein